MRAVALRVVPHWSTSGASATHSPGRSALATLCAATHTHPCPVGAHHAMHTLVMIVLLGRSTIFDLDPGAMTSKAGSESGTIKISASSRSIAVPRRFLTASRIPRDRRARPPRGAPPMARRLPVTLEAATGFPRRRPRARAPMTVSGPPSSYNTARRPQGRPTAMSIFTMEGHQRVGVLRCEGWSPGAVLLLSLPQPCGLHWCHDAQGRLCGRVLWCGIRTTPQAYPTQLRLREARPAR